MLSEQEKIQLEHAKGTLREVLGTLNKQAAGLLKQRYPSPEAIPEQEATVIDALLGMVRDMLISRPSEYERGALGGGLPDKRYWVGDVTQPAGNRHLGYICAIEQQAFTEQSRYLEGGMDVMADIFYDRSKTRTELQRARRDWIGQDNTTFLYPELLITCTAMYVASHPENHGLFWEGQKTPAELVNIFMQEAQEAVMPQR